MKTFRTWLLEKQFKHLKVKGQWTKGEIVDVDIFINPNSSELKRAQSGSRGVIDQKGNLIIFELNRHFIHEDIIELLKPILKLGGRKYDWNEIGFDELKAVAIQRLGDTIAVAESQRPFGFDEEESWKFGNNLFLKAAKKNPSLKFVFKSIREIR